MRGIALLIAVTALHAVASSAASGAAVHGAPSAPWRTSGAAGPYRNVTLVLTPTGDRAYPNASFGASLDIGDGWTIPLAGPSDPADYFILEPTMVLFTPISRRRENGIVVLYRASQVGPGHGTEHLALVYRVWNGGAWPQPAIERRLAGARTAAEVRRRLRALWR